MKIKNETIKEVLKNGGGTLLKGEVVTFDEGYIVGQYNLNKIDTKVIKEEDSIINTVMTVIERSNEEMIGLWIEDGVIYIDNVQLVKEIEDAVKQAKENGELAIWDNSNQDVIYMDEVEGEVN